MAASWYLRLCVVLLSVCLAWAHMDEEVLLAFKDSIENWQEVYEGRSMQGWEPCKPGNCIPICTWTGVECDLLAADDHVTSLSLACDDECSVKAVGQLLPDLAYMEHLAELDLSGNAFYGTLPLEWGYNGTFKSLSILNVNSNNLSGPIPDEWSANYGFPLLAECHLAENQLTGSLDSWATTETAWHSLMVWSVGDNRLSGPLPHDVNGLITMAVVSLQGNQFTGTIPPNWGRTAYTYINSSANVVSLNVTQALVALYLSDNQLSGTLPVEWAGSDSFVTLKNLQLGGNRFNSTLPSAWGSKGAWAALGTLNISSAQLIGELPGAWGDGMPKLKTLELYGNSLSGTVPASWNKMPSLQQLYVQPGNPQLCPQAPEGADFQLCDKEETVCMTSLEPDDSSACSGVPPSSDSGGGSSVPVVAIVVPVVAVVALAAAGLALFLHCRRQKGTEAAKSASYVPSDAVFYGAGEQSNGGSAWGAGSAATGLSPAAPLGAQPSSPPKTGSLCGASSWHLPCTGSDKEREVPPSTASTVSSYMATRTISHLNSAPNTGSGPMRPVGSDGQHSSGGPFTNTELEAYLSDWKIKPEEIEILRRPDGSKWQLGAGGYGKVYKALRNGVQAVAVKVLTADCNMNGADFNHEIAILRACRDTNIVQFQGVCIGPQGTMLVTEYMEGGNLFYNIHRGTVSWYRRGKRVALQVARGLAFLHSKKILHLDIKSGNVLLTRQGDAKIADLGSSKLIVTKDQVTATVGTLAWCPPELLMGHKCTLQSDIFSLGVVLWEIVTGEQPVRGKMRDVRVPEECPSEVRAIILQCLETNPALRPSAVQLVEMLGKASDVAPEGSQLSIRTAKSAPAMSRRKAVEVPSNDDIVVGTPCAHPASDPLHAPATPTDAGVAGAAQQPQDLL